MTTSAVILEAPSPLLEAFHRELHAEGEIEFSTRASHAVPWRVWHRALGGPLGEFLARPGKEFRGELVRLFFRIGAGREAMPPNLPLVVEALHAGSLIVDDVEDDSTERRGRPALHRIHGVPTALNSGNWLYFWASALLDEIEMPEQRRATAHRLMTRSLIDCHYGQALDLAVRISELSRAEIPGVVRASTELKTGSLLALAAGLGALVGGASEDTVAAAIRFGRELGVGLQMLDDLGGLTSPRRAHKGHEDLVHDRPSWPWAWFAASLPGTAFEEVREQARDVADGADPASLAGKMRALLMPLAPRRVHEHLEAAHARLSTAIPTATSTLSTLRREMERLEKSYV